MYAAVEARLGGADVAVFAAAVADFRPESPREGKVKRSEVGGRLDVALTANPDVAGGTRAARKEGAVVVGFALETSDLVANARAKLEAKGFDLIVANDAGEAGAGFEVETNRVTLLGGEGEAETLPLQSKDEVAEAVLDRVAAMLGGRGVSGAGVRALARLLRQRQEMGAPALVLDDTTRDALLAVVAAARREAAGPPRACRRPPGPPRRHRQRRPRPPAAPTRPCRASRPDGGRPPRRRPAPRPPLGLRRAP